MQGKNKYRIKGSIDFLRYHADDMDNLERNAFEKSLQKDPFAEEASEGFAGKDPPIVRKDMAELTARLNRRIKGKRKYIWYRIAASVAAVMILALVFRFNREQKTAEQAAGSPEPLVIMESPVIRENEQEPAAFKNQVAVVTNRREKQEITERASGLAMKTEPVAVVHVAEDQVLEITEEVQVEVPTAMAEKVSPPSVNRDVAAPGQSPAVHGKIISAEDHQPLPGVMVTVKGSGQGAITDSGGDFRMFVKQPEEKVFVASFIGMEPKEFKAQDDSGVVISLEPSPMALDEMVVLGYGRKKLAPVKAESPEGYTPPQPVNGKAEFDRYIRDKIKRPDSTSTGQRVVVVLRFMVEKTGIPDSIEVVRSPGKSFSDEAIRLLKEGPVWKPAQEKGKIIRELVTVRIVFQ